MRSLRFVRADPPEPDRRRPARTKRHGHLFLGTYKGIFRSIDRGVSFTRVIDAASNVLVDSKGNVFAFGEGIAMSRDGGDTWESRLLGVNAAPRAAALANDRIYLNTALGHYLSTTTTAW
ncbi:hypothetical protein [Sorangium sp. So ce1335]|uniref:hypothetical protein n=1 Tax=Sorangium sp. So ce1335 TaxID=3133335 RepID=UPI003F61C8D9